MTPDDFAKLHAAAFSESRPWSAEEFAHLLASEHCFWVGDSRGFSLGRVIAGESELLTIAVDPLSQGQGLGRLLLQHYHQEAQSRGAELAFLEVAEDNVTALNLYKSDNYSISGTRSAYYKRPDGTAVDALMMQRKF